MFHTFGYGTATVWGYCSDPYQENSTFWTSVSLNSAYANNLPVDDHHIAPLDAKISSEIGREMLSNFSEEIAVVNALSFRP